MPPAAARQLSGAFHDAADDLERFIDPHMGCVAGFFGIFDRPGILSGKRRPPPCRSSSPSVAGSTSPSGRSEASASPFLSDWPPSPPETAAPPAPRPSVELPNGAWKLREAPRLSLDSRAIVDSGGKIRPREIRSLAPVTGVSFGDESGRRNRSPSVVARLMGLDELPGTSPAAELRRSASERRHPDAPYNRFVDTCFFHKPPSSSPSPPVELAPVTTPVRPTPTRAAFPRQSRLEVRDVFPEPTTKRPGEITLYGEIERRLRMRGVVKPAKDMETLKQVLDALKLNGELRPAGAAAPARGPTAGNCPVVLIKPASRLPRPSAMDQSAPRRDARKLICRSPPPEARSPARSPVSPARRPAATNADRTRSLRSNCTIFPEQGSTIARRSRRRSTLETVNSPPPEEDGLKNIKTELDFEDFRVNGSEMGRILGRCDKLLSSIAALTESDRPAPAADQHPSPVSVLDPSAYLADEGSPSPVNKPRAIVFDPDPIRTVTSSDDDECSSAGDDDSDYAYVALAVRSFDRHGLLRLPHGDRLFVDAVSQALNERRGSWPCDAAGKETDAAEVWAEVRQMREPVIGGDMDGLLCRAVERDLAGSGDRRWARPTAEMSGVALQMEQMVFRDLISDAIREMWWPRQPF